MADQTWYTNKSTEVVVGNTTTTTSTNAYGAAGAAANVGNAAGGILQGLVAAVGLTYQIVKDHGFEKDYTVKKTGEPFTSAPDSRVDGVKVGSYAVRGIFYTHTRAWALTPKTASVLKHTKVKKDREIPTDKSSLEVAKKKLEAASGEDRRAIEADLEERRFESIYLSSVFPFEITWELYRPAPPKILTEAEEAQLMAKFAEERAVVAAEHSKAWTELLEGLDKNGVKKNQGESSEAFLARVGGLAGSSVALPVGAYTAKTNACAERLKAIGLARREAAQKIQADRARVQATQGFFMHNVQIFPLGEVDGKKADKWQNKTINVTFTLDRCERSGVFGTKVHMDFWDICPGYSHQVLDEMFIWPHEDVGKIQIEGDGKLGRRYRQFMGQPVTSLDPPAPDYVPNPPSGVDAEDDSSLDPPVPDYVPNPPLGADAEDDSLSDSGTGLGSGPGASMDGSNRSTGKPKASQSLSDKLKAELERANKAALADIGVGEYKPAWYAKDGRAVIIGNVAHGKFKDNKDLFPSGMIAGTIERAASKAPGKPSTLIAVVNIPSARARGEIRDGISYLCSGGEVVKVKKS